jgi:DNA-binding transcriptional LysR family regulator
MYTNLDMNCLRTFVMIVDSGSFADAAERVGRTASAVSLQIARLEEQVGVKLFRKQGRRMVPSPDGEHLLVTAREVLALNDQAVDALAHAALSGEVRIGAIQDFADGALPQVLSRFRQSHPGVRIAARVDRSKSLADAVDKGALDLAVGVSGWSSRRHVPIRTDKMEWFGEKTLRLSRDRPVPLAVFEQPCSFREAAITALNEAGREWDIVFTSPSLSGLRAAVKAGLGVTVRTSLSFAASLKPLPKSSGLPDLPTVDFALYTAAELSAPARRLSELIADHLK